ncbi:MAG: hypothetical protein ACREOO_24460 [bacterium]
MKTMKKVIVSLCMLLVSPFCAFAQETSEAVVTGNVAGAFMSNYVWRGQKLSPESVIHPTVGISFAGFTANLWTCNDLELNETTETDLTLSYMLALSPVTIDFGYINYAFDGFKDTQEFYAGAALGVLLRPAVKFYYDFDEGKGGYLAVSVAHSVKLSERVSLDLSALGSANFDNGILGRDVAGEEFTGLYTSQLTAALTIPILKYVAVIPSVTYSFPLGNDAEAAIKAISYDGDSSIVFGGAALSFTF